VGDVRQFATAAELREAANAIAVSFTDGNGNEHRIGCRRPDPVALFANNMLPLNIFASVVEKMGDTIASFSAAALKDPTRYADFVDRWVCAAAVNPRVVMTEEEAVAEPASLWVEDLLPQTRLAIFVNTSDRLASKRTVDAIAEFRGQQSVDPAPGSGSTPVPHPTVDALVG
jgi:hypothetical protein